MPEMVVAVLVVDSLLALEDYGVYREPPRERCPKPSTMGRERLIRELRRACRESDRFWSWLGQRHL